MVCNIRETSVISLSLCYFFIIQDLFEEKEKMISHLQRKLENERLLRTEVETELKLREEQILEKGIQQDYCNKLLFHTYYYLSSDPCFSILSLTALWNL